MCEAPLCSCTTNHNIGATLLSVSVVITRYRPEPARHLGRFGGWLRGCFCVLPAPAFRDDLPVRRIIEQTGLYWWANCWATKCANVQSPPAPRESKPSVEVPHAHSVVDAIWWQAPNHHSAALSGATSLSIRHSTPRSSVRRRLCSTRTIYTMPQLRQERPLFRMRPSSAQSEPHWLLRSHLKLSLRCRCADVSRITSRNGVSI